MKKYLFLLMVLLFNICYGADTKVSDLTALGSATTDDLLYIVDGAATSKKITFDNLQSSVTKLGTIATGVWQGTAIATGYGGTGAASLNDLITLTTHTTGNYVATIADGTGIDGTAAGEGATYTPTFDATELSALTWSAGGSASIAWSWNLSAGDPTITFGNDLVTLSNSLTVATGKNITVGTTQWSSSDEIDGTKIKDADYGDITVSAAGVWAVEDDSHDHSAAGSTVTINASDIIDKHAGTDITVDLEEEVTEGSLADSTIVSADIKDGTLVDADMANDALDPDKLVGDGTDDDKVDEDIIEDRFIKNHTSDVMTGTLTADGLTLGADESITLGASTIKYETTRADIIIGNDIIAEDINPSIWIRSIGDNSAWGLHYHIGENYPLGFFTGTDDGTGVVVGNDGFPIWYVDSSYNFRVPHNDVYINQDLKHEFSRSAVVENLAAADDNMSLGAFTNNVTITKVGCVYIGTGTLPATIALEDGSGNAMTHNTCTCVATGTDITFTAVTANNTLNAGELLRFDTTNAVNPETDEYTIVIGYTE